MKNLQFLVLGCCFIAMLFSCSSEEKTPDNEVGTINVQEEDADDSVSDFPAFSVEDFEVYDLEEYNLNVKVKAPVDATVKPGNMSDEVFHSAVVKKGDFFIEISSEIKQLPEDSDAETAYRDVMELMSLTPEFELVDETSTGGIYKRKGGYSFYYAYTKEERLYVIQPAFVNEGYPLPVVKSMFLAAQLVE